MSLLTKIALNTVGVVCVGLGVLGIVLPLLPATPFLLLASACFVRGSERLNRRLLENKYLGPYITNIKERRGLPLRAKVYTLLLLWPSILLSAYRLNSLPLLLLLVACGSIGTAVVLSLKTLKE
ncbi:MAG TPA: YbaN family protein [Pyrinomonadaceae bacterium]|nr:YbaN family protein [Pyrinomonadaceae bacterium]